MITITITVLFSEPAKKDVKKVIFIYILYIYKYKILNFFFLFKSNLRILKLLLLSLSLEEKMIPTNALIGE